jgi:2-haloalkanoic acid dehalogenase type II
VTLDAYGTVFDFEGCLPGVVEEALASGGVRGLSPRELADSWGVNFAALYEEFGTSWRDAGLAFKSIATLTADALEITYRQYGLQLDPWLGTNIWLERLRAVEYFPEVSGVLAALASRVELAMISDTDDAILAPAIARLRPPFRLILTSEGVRAYKHDPRATLFRRALAELGLPAESVLHVGDSAADVSGAGRAGMLTAWVNRHRRRLPPRCPRPDWEIADLSALPGILERAS